MEIGMRASGLHAPSQHARYPPWLDRSIGSLVPRPLRCIIVSSGSWRAVSSSPWLGRTPRSSSAFVSPLHPPLFSCDRARPYDRSARDMWVFAGCARAPCVPTALPSCSLRCCAAVAAGRGAEQSFSARPLRTAKREQRHRRSETRERVGNQLALVLTRSLCSLCCLDADRVACLPLALARSFSCSSWLSAST